MNALQFILAILGTIGGIISLITAVVSRQKQAVQVSGILLMLVGLIVAVGYVADVPSIYTFPGNKTGMALPTALCFFVTGACLFILSNEIEFKKKNRPHDE